LFATSTTESIASDHQQALPGWLLAPPLERNRVGRGRHEETGMNGIKHVLLCVIRLVLVVAAPRFAFSQATRGQQYNTNYKENGSEKH
jgi:hypothetical protein